MKIINPLRFLLEEWTSDVDIEQAESSINANVFRTVTKEDPEIGNFYDLSPRNGGDWGGPEITVEDEHDIIES